MHQVLFLYDLGRICPFIFSIYMRDVFIYLFCFVGVVVVGLFLYKNSFPSFLPYNQECKKKLLHLCVYVWIDLRDVYTSLVRIWFFFFRTAFVYRVLTRFISSSAHDTHIHFGEQEKKRRASMETTQKPSSRCSMYIHTDWVCMYVCVWVVAVTLDGKLLIGYFGWRESNNCQHKAHHIATDFL